MEMQSIGEVMPVPKVFKDVMIDIETMGTAADAVICAIGAVEFDLQTGEIGRSISIAVNINSFISRGLTISADTLTWWLTRSASARHAILSNSIELPAALMRLSIWLSACNFDLLKVTSKL